MPSSATMATDDYVGTCLSLFPAARPVGTCKIPNPYYEIFCKCEGWIFDKRMCIDRRKLIRKFSWAIPTDEAIRVIAKLSPIIEIGAGRGYWAALISKAGGDIMAYDIKPPRTVYHRVFRGGPERAAKTQARCLFLCWPIYSDSMACECLQNFQGRYLAYVGESRDGCTADDDFYEMREQDWELQQSIVIPQWWGLHDDLTIWRRRK